MHQFDPSLPGLIEGDVTNVAVNESPPFSPFSLANSVIDNSEPFDIAVEWNVSGPLATLWITALGSPWLVRVYAESQGPGPEILLSTTSVSAATFAGTTNDRTYTATMSVPANTLPEDVGGDSGLYRLTASVFLNSSLGAPGYDMIGFSDGPVIQVENPV